MHVKNPKHRQPYHCLDTRKHCTCWQEWVALLLQLLPLTPVRRPKFPAWGHWSAKKKKKKKKKLKTKNKTKKVDYFEGTGREIKKGNNPSRVYNYAVVCCFTFHSIQLAMRFRFSSPLISAFGVPHRAGLHLDFNLHFRGVSFYRARHTSIQTSGTRLVLHNLGSLSVLSGKSSAKRIIFFQFAPGVE